MQRYRVCARFPDLLGTHHSVVGRREWKVVNGLLVGKVVLMINQGVAGIQNKLLVAPHSYVLQQRAASSLDNSHNGGHL